MNSTEKTPQLHLDNQLCFALYSASRLVIRSYTPLLKPMGLTYPQYLVLLVLWQTNEEKVEGLSIKQLCEKLLLDTGTLTPLLKRMEKAGLISRRRNTTDEREVQIFLTERSREMHKEARSIPARLSCNSSSEINELMSLKNNLEKLINELKS